MPVRANRSASDDQLRRRSRRQNAGERSSNKGLIREFRDGGNRCLESLLEGKQVLIRNADDANGAETAPSRCWRGGMASFPAPPKASPVFPRESASSAFRNRSNSPRRSLCRRSRWMAAVLRPYTIFPKFPEEPNKEMFVVNCARLPRFLRSLRRLLVLGFEWVAQSHSYEFGLSARPLAEL